ncbi:butirosin biosynthesis protein H-like [Anaerobacterium chartisolvens]|uniref:Butirosin biosynthesis protein H-like n=1 Tax=Anaerobacterium chartisolvens TaxID=1297424 RepID=A0A369BHQ7_9FIRM|nr:BtrH N-terminal domain-containing protein [Anaerobacterium chartisolvens]RCX20096.1 butirosin biosynthesis protein H-like [Anaerobacterium chartisolvens]
MNNATKDNAMLQVRYPLITSYTSDAHMLAILSAYPHTEEWVFNNYINLLGEEPSIRNDFSILRFHSWLIRKACPYFKIRYFDKKFFDSDITEFIISKIDSGNYVTILYDQYYIPSSTNYNRTHFAHELLIYGYDRKMKVFYVADFFENSRYTFAAEPFIHVERAIISALESEPFSCNEIEFCNVNYKFNNYFLYNSLNNFLYSKNTIAEGENVVFSDCEKEQIQKGKYIFGIKTYGLLKRILSEVLHDIMDFSDIRPLHVILDHKIMMCERLKYLVNAGVLDGTDPIIAQYSDIKDICQANRNLFIKFGMTRDLGLIDKIFYKMDIMESLEIEAITYFIKKLSV